MTRSLADERVDDRIREKESINQMSVSNLSIVFGPTLLGAPPSMGGLNLEHMSFQCKVSEAVPFFKMTWTTH